MLDRKINVQMVPFTRCKKVLRFIVVVILMNFALITYRSTNNAAIYECYTSSNEDPSNNTSLNSIKRFKCSSSAMIGQQKSRDPLPNDLMRKTNSSSTLNATTAKVAITQVSSAISPQNLPSRRVKVNPFRHRFLIKEERLCSEDTTMLILVHSYHEYVDKRRAIRETWGAAVRSRSWFGTNITERLDLAFVFGLHKEPKWNEAIAEESRKYGDVIQGDFMDAYVNMTLKSLLGLKFVSTYCKGVKYFLKSDDDMIINIPLLLVVLRRLNFTRSIVGPLWDDKPRVYRTGKWAIPASVYPKDYFPPYEAGSAYVISSDIVGELFALSEYVPPIFIDDVYITGILGEMIGVNHVKQGGFAFAYQGPPTVCDLVMNRIITGTRMTYQLLTDMWNSIKNGIKCT